MDINKLESITKTIGQNFDTNRRHGKNWNKKQKVHSKDKPEEERIKKEEAFTRKDSEITQDEKDVLDVFYGAEDEELLKDELWEEREGKKHIPKELRKFKTSSGKGFFRCVYCMERYSYWNKHKINCIGLICHICETCGEEYTIDNSHTCKKICTECKKTYKNLNEHRCSKINPNFEKKAKRKLKLNEYPIIKIKDTDSN